MKSTDLAFTTIDRLARMYRSGEAYPTGVTEQMLERINHVDPHIGAFTHVATSAARAAAECAEAELEAGLDRGPLHGVPIALKDIFFNEDMPTTAGMLATPAGWRTGTATVYERLKTAGAVVLGSVVTAEGMFAGYNPRNRAPLNPWGEALWSGTSSSGPAVALAAGLCYGSIGSDTGGSIRLPAAANGVTGLKPTWGRVSRFGVAPFAPSLDHIGCFARSARDAQTLLSAIEGYDYLDPTCAREPASIRNSRIIGVPGSVVGFDRRYVEGAPAETHAAIQALLNVLVSLGARVVDIRMPPVEPAMRAWKVIASAEMAAGHRVLYQQHPHMYGRELAGLINDGLAVTTDELTRAEEQRTAFRLALGDMFSSIDVSICPAFVGNVPTIEEWDAPEVEQAGDVTKYTSPYNLAGTPTVTLPVSVDARGAPLGLQLCGRSFEEATLTQICGAVQSATDWHLRRPNLIEDR